MYIGGAHMFKWREDFSVNIKIIDDQHKELFRIGNALYDIVSIKDGIDRYDEILEALYSLRDYAIYHFDYEEQMMKKNDYPGYFEHKKQHDEFIRKVKSMDEESIDKDQIKASMDLIIFVANWIENHILKTDMEYKDYLNNKGIF